MPPITREQIRHLLRPLAQLVRSVVIEARDACDVELVAEATPHIQRIAHLRRLSGTQRWMVIADGLVARAAEMPDGYGVMSSELDHNRSRYAFLLPEGLMTIRREPHDEDEGTFIQDRLDGIIEQAQLADDVDAFVGIKIYLSVPPAGSVQFIATHKTLEEPIVVTLDELERPDDGVVVPLNPPSSPPPTTVRSTRSRKEDDKNVGEDS